MYLDKVKARVEELQFIRRDRIIPCTQKEVAYLEQRLHVSLPLAYKEFLLWMGKGAGPFMAGSDFFYYRLIDIQAGATELLEEDALLKHLPEDAFVFQMHQGYTFTFFRVKEGADPPVYSYLERSGQTTFTRVDDHFSDSLLALIEDSARIIAELAKSPGKRTLLKSPIDEAIAYYRKKHVSSHE